MLQIVQYRNPHRLDLLPAIRHLQLDHDRKQTPFRAKRRSDDRVPAAMQSKEIEFPIHEFEIQPSSFAQHVVRTTWKLRVGIVTKMIAGTSQSTSSTSEEEGEGMEREHSLYSMPQFPAVHTF